MKPGRELDMLVAEKVMGWSNSIGSARSDHMWGIMDFDDKGPVLAANFPSYSEDIAAAWELMEKLKGPEMGVSICTLWEQPNTFKWIAKIEFLGTERFEFAVEESAAHAICLAALKAIGVKV